MGIVGWSSSLLGAAIAASGWRALTPRRRRRTSSSFRHWSIGPAPMPPTASRSPTAVADYLAMINERDGGINGVKILTEECETGYPTDRGVECYERLKNKGPTGAAAFSPLSTGITYALIERAPADQIPIVSMGYGRADSADGRCSPGCSRCSAPIGRRRYAGPVHRDAGGRLRQAEGQEDRLHLSRLALRQGTDPGVPGAVQDVRVRARDVSGRRTGPGAEVHLAAARASVPAGLDVHVGLGSNELHRDQGGRRRRLPARHFIGVWWSGAEPDVIPAGDGAIGYKSGAHACGRPAGGCAPRHLQDICTPRAKAPRNPRRSDRCSTTAA